MIAVIEMSSPSRGSGGSAESGADSVGKSEVNVMLLLALLGASLFLLEFLEPPGGEGYGVCGSLDCSTALTALTLRLRGET